MEGDGAPRVTEGLAPFGKYETWYRIDGVIGDKLPLVAVNGGPGSIDIFFTPLRQLASDGQAVVTYQQTDCGRSTGPGRPEAWTVQLFVDQLDALREHLGLEQMALLGQSWGGWLVQEYTLQHPDRVAGLILSSTSASVAEWIDAVQPLVDAMPPDVVAALHEHEANHTTEHPDYQAASMAFMKRHMCRLDPWPDIVVEDFAALNTMMYNAMWGPSEFRCTGTLQGWTSVERLGQLTMPTLVLSGRFDEVTPVCQRTFVERIRDCRWVLLDDSAHYGLWEETARYLEEASTFLNVLGARVN